MTNRNRVQSLAASVLLLACAACGVDSNGDANSADTITTKTGLKYIEEKIGDGAEAKSGDKVSVHYTGTLKNGKKFDSSRDRDKPIDFVLGTGGVIKGWDEGIAGMKVGGKRKLIIPSELGYGKRGFPPTIPPNAELHFDVELVAVSGGGAKPANSKTSNPKPENSKTDEPKPENSKEEK
jgi:peptidylprolyl isomerase